MTNPSSPPTREHCLQLDDADPLRSLRDLFELPPGLIYLDGNSLGVLPRATAARVQQVVQQEWGRDLIGSWNSAGWITLAQRVGDKIAACVGARPGELVAADSTSVNLYKVLSAAGGIVQAGARSNTNPNASPHRRVIVSERDNFPTDLYIAQSLARERGLELRLVQAGQIAEQLNDELAVLMLTQVNYRTGALHDMAALTRAAHAAGGLAVWDLAHSAGALPVDLHGSDADFAVGCGYKYLNGGPGAPAFVWVHPRWADRFEQPLSGWLGHAAPFEFSPDYRPAAGVARYLCGTPPILAMAALECGVNTVLATGPLGGMAALRAKSLALTRLFITLVEARCAGHGLTLVTPRDDAQRGSQVCLSHPHAAYPMVQALIARGVVGDFRAPDILRFGFTPLYTRFTDLWDAVEHLQQVLESGQWREARFNQRATVT